MTPGYGRVALPLPLSQPYTYRIPAAIADRVMPGARVLVPVRNREMTGVVVDLTEESPVAASRDILSAPDQEPALPPALFDTARWMAGYYAAPLGTTLRCLLPGPLWGESQAIITLAAGRARTGGLAGSILDWLESHGGSGAVSSLARALKRPVWDAVNRLVRAGLVTLRVEPASVDDDAATERVLVLDQAALSLLEREAVFRRAPAQRILLESLEELGGTAPMRHLKDQLKFKDGVIRALVARGVAHLEQVSRVRDPFAGTAGSPPPAHPTADQAEAIRQIEALPPGEGALLFGVTGSGKTLVYLEVIRRALAQGRGAIILVPEISLTPQTVSRVRGAFGDQVAVLHSGLSDGERADAWRLLRQGERRVAVGARSAIFAPVARLGVIVIDEEHEASYKNGESPRYHAREVALVRSRLEGARLVLGSATPSAESIVRVGPRLRLLRLPERVGIRPLPPVELIDLRTAPLVAEASPVPWSESLDRALLGTLSRGEQALLLLNRRGYAAYLQCPACGTVRECRRCSISLTVHQAPPRLRCHYCGDESPLDSTCGQCGAGVQRMRGIGTQQLERMIAMRYPTARLARMDLDTTSTKWSHHRILESFGRGEVDVLLGTQMIAKGLDFPNVTLVGVVDADTGLHLPDFRAAERTFQLLAQVAGRAGRGPKGGKVLVQTRQPGHHALVAAARHDTEGFLKEELALRESPPYPPTVSLVNVVVSGTDERGTGKAAADLGEWFSALIVRQQLPVVLLGPAPCPLARIKDRWRWHVLLKGKGEEIGRVVRYAATHLRHGRAVRVILDRDPVSLL